jgi:hypothetical protein
MEDGLRTGVESGRRELGAELVQRQISATAE